MMKAWYEKSINALQLNGKGERTQEAYTRGVRMLVEFYHKSQDQIIKDDLQRYFLHRRNVNR
jgi:integrase/recombinase XerD